MTELKFPAKILYVEDQADNVSTVKRVCMTRQISMDHAPNYASGISIIQGKDSARPLNGYGLLLLDYNLGDGIGSNLAVEARELGFQGPIVMYSGNDHDLASARQKTQHLPNIRSLKKPARLEEFLKALVLETSSQIPD